VIACTADDQDLDVIIDVGAVDEVSVQQPHADRRRVVLVRPVEGEIRDFGLFVLLVLDELLRLLDEIFSSDRHCYSPHAVNK
jgi:hypothetical protein